MTATAQSIHVGLFHVTYEVGSGMPGAPMLALNLAVDTPSKHVTGLARVTQVTAPPFPVTTSAINGNYTYMATMKSTHILVVATGYPVISWPAGGGIGPVIQPNFELRMVLESDWSSGTASFKYYDGTGWHSIDNVPVKKTDVVDLAAAGLPEAILYPDTVEATWSDGVLVIRASGVEDGYTDIHIDVSPADIWPPIYQVVGRETPAIGSFPYDVSRSFPMEDKPDAINFSMKGGDQKIPVN